LRWSRVESCATGLGLMTPSVQHQRREAPSAACCY
jgi:hypothetical protein